MVVTNDNVIELHASTEPPDFSGGMYSKRDKAPRNGLASTEPPDFSGGMLCRSRAFDYPVSRFNGAA